MASFYDKPYKFLFHRHAVTQNTKVRKNLKLNQT